MLLTVEGDENCFFFFIFLKVIQSQNQGSFIWKVIPGLKMFGTVFVQSPSIFYVMAPPLFKRPPWAISGSFFPLFQAKSSFTDRRDILLPCANLAERG